MDPRLPALEVLGVRVAQLTGDVALAEIARLHESGIPSSVGYVNAHTLNLAHRSPAFREALNRMALVLNDGSGLAWAAKRQGQTFPENLNGTDFTPRILELAASQGWPVFFLGAKPGIAERAAAVWAARLPGVRIAGTRDGYFGPKETARVTASIRSSQASLLIVAMGNPTQELWLDAHLASTGCCLGVGVGAFLDFSAGVVKRSPVWMQHAGVEWVYRLVQEPGRMWQRYIIGNPLFMTRVIVEQLRK